VAGGAIDVFVLADRFRDVLGKPQFSTIALPTLACQSRMSWASAAGSLNKPPWRLARARMYSERYAAARRASTRPR
jgi:hypothetical protein